jgi:hypothetical protein
VHCPLPLQVPVLPQVEEGIAAHTPAGSAAPAGTGAQVPCLPGSPQELQLPQLATAQQSPLVQWVLMQSAPVAHECPFWTRLVHEPDWQVSPPVQSLSVVQLVRHAFAPQTYGSHIIVGEGAQDPAPVQWETSVAMPAAHPRAPQLVAVTAFRQAPSPSHLPS